jgi:RHS repeat-associated protein
MVGSGVVSTGHLFCALLAAVRLAIGTVGGYTGAETRVRGIDLALSTVIRGVEAASSGTHPGNGYHYGETASDRANQYNGRVFDPGTGFHDYGARMYWPQIGRFISADSYQGDIGNPASLNRYSYVLNNPYRYTDPSGHETQVIIVHSTVLGMDMGYHAAIRVDNDGAGQPILFDPGGSYQYDPHEPRGSGGYFNGQQASLEKFVNWQKEDGDRPFVYKFDTTPEQEALIASRFGYNPDPSKDEAKDPGAGDCSKAVSSAISGVGPFKKVKGGTFWPGNLEDDLKKVQKDAAAAKTTESTEKKK